LVKKMHLRIPIKTRIKIKATGVEGEISPEDPTLILHNQRYLVALDDGTCTHYFERDFEVIGPMLIEDYGRPDCDHQVLMFYSGGYYIGCVMCQARWVAIKPFGPDTEIDNTRRGDGLRVNEIQGSLLIISEEGKED
jgi:hypothetical protein